MKKILLISLMLLMVYGCGFIRNMNKEKQHTKTETKEDTKTSVQTDIKKEEDETTKTKQVTTTEIETKADTTKHDFYSGPVKDTTLISDTPGQTVTLRITKTGIGVTVIDKAKKATQKTTVETETKRQLNSQIKTDKDSSAHVVKKAETETKTKKVESKSFELIGCAITILIGVLLVFFSKKKGWI